MSKCPISLFGYQNWFIFEGFIIMIASTLLFLFLIINGKTRTQQHYQILAGCTCFDIIFGLNYFTSGLFHVTNEECKVHLITRLQCLNHFHLLLFIFLTPMSGLITMTTSLDRAFSVLDPIRYLKLGKWYMIAIFLGPVPFPIICLIYSYVYAYTLRNTPDAPHNCLLHGTVPAAVYLIMRIVRIVATCIGVAAYIPVVYKTLQIIERNRRASTTSGNNRAGRKQVIQASITVGLITLNEFIMFAVSDSYLLIKNEEGWSYAFILNLNKGMLDIIIVLVAQRELRSLIMASICCYWSRTPVKNFTIPKTNNKGS